MKKLLLLCIFLLFSAGIAYCAVGCDLNDPDRDVIRLFPGATGYNTYYYSIEKSGGQPLLAEIEERLGEKFKGLYETIDVPYTFYEILRGKMPVGYIHGVNQKGQYGGIQVFLSLDKKGKIMNFYVQKITSRKAGLFRDRAFAKQFEGLDLKDFSKYDIISQKAPAGSRVNNIKSPGSDVSVDFAAVMRGVKKDLILFDEFIAKGKK